MSNLRYTWQPASEPPDTDRDVLLCDDRAEMWVGFFYGERWHAHGCVDAVLRVTHWRDIAPPDAVEPPEAQR